MNIFAASRCHAIAGALVMGVALSACVAPAPQTAPPPAPPPSVAAIPGMGPASHASTLQDYRIEAAYHLYAHNRNRIYTGVLPHFLYAIGVLEVQVDQRGQVLALNWLRAPMHAPEVVAEIERTVRQAAPFPAPLRLGSASYLETWLWDASGNFQLHTLSEGQGPAGTSPRALPPNPFGVRMVAAPTLDD